MTVQSRGFRVRVLEGAQADSPRSAREGKWPRAGSPEHRRRRLGRADRRQRPAHPGYSGVRVIPELAGHVRGTAADSQPPQRPRDCATDLVKGRRPGRLQGRQEQRCGPDPLKRAWRLAFGKRRLRSQDFRHRSCLASLRLRGLLMLAPHVSSFTPASAYVFKASAQPDYRPAGMAELRSAGDAGHWATAPARTHGWLAAEGDADGEPR